MNGAEETGEAEAQKPAVAAVPDSLETSESDYEPECEPLPNEEAMLAMQDQLERLQKRKHLLFVKLKGILKDEEEKKAAAEAEKQQQQELQRLEDDERRSALSLLPSRGYKAFPAVPSYQQSLPCAPTLGDIASPPAGMHVAAASLLYRRKRRQRTDRCCCTARAMASQTLSPLPTVARGPLTARVCTAWVRTREGGGQEGDTRRPVAAGAPRAAVAAAGRPPGRS